MTSLHEEANELWEEIYGLNGTNPYMSQKDFFQLLREKSGAGFYDVKYEVNRQFMLKELADADDINSLKNVLEKVIKQVKWS